jgi:hypothetical protein
MSKKYQEVRRARGREGFEIRYQTRDLENDIYVVQGVAGLIFGLKYRFFRTKILI